jgi:hypothetical protein
MLELRPDHPKVGADMTWFMIAYAVGLFYFAANPTRIANRKRFRIAWMLFAVVPMVTAFFTFLRTFTVGFTRSMAILEITSTSLSWLCIGVSFLILLGAILPPENRPADVNR